MWRRVGQCQGSQLQSGEFGLCLTAGVILTLSCAAPGRVRGDPGGGEGGGQLQAAQLPVHRQVLRPVPRPHGAEHRLDAGPVRGQQCGHQEAGRALHCNNRVTESTIPRPTAGHQGPAHPVQGPARQEPAQDRGRVGAAAAV